MMHVSSDVYTRNLLRFFTFFTVFSYIYFIAVTSSSTPTHLQPDDSGIFLVFGYGWKNGLLPYVDLFDHKGPLLFFINLIGFSIFNNEYGIILVEIFFCVTWILLFLYLCKDNIFIGNVALWIVLVFNLQRTFQDGNFTEEYSIAFSIAALFVSFHISKKSIKYVLYGFLAAIIFFIRPNNAAFIFVLFCFEVANNFTWREVCRASLWAGLGFLTVTLPILGYFYVNDALFAMIQCSLIANFVYTSAGRINSIFSFLDMIPIYNAVLVVLLFYIFLTQRAFFIKAMIVVTFTYGLSIMSLRFFPHYFMSMIPPFLYIIAHLSKDECKRVATYRAKLDAFMSNKISQRYFAYILLVLALGVIVVGAHRLSFSYEMSKKNALLDDLSSLGMSSQSKILNLSNNNVVHIFYYMNVLPDEPAFFPVTFIPYYYKEEFFQKLRDFSFLQKYDFILVSPKEQLVTLPKNFKKVGMFGFSHIYKNTER